MDSDDRNRADVRAELERILSSSGFARNARLSRFLRYLVEQHLQGNHAAIKESLIGMEVFGRKPDYDPKLDSIVRTEAGRLRARLLDYYAGPGKADPLVIEVPKGGYAPVMRSAPVRSELPKPRAKWALPASVAALSIILIAAALWWVRQPRSPIVIAVLPLDNLSREADSDYFVDGLTDEIIRNLSGVDGLIVRSRTSSFGVTGQPRTVREAGRQLQADYIVEGSVLREGAQLRINAQLVRVHDDVPLWSGKFDRELTNVFAIQEEISFGIVNSLRLHLGRGRRRYETSVEAYDLYLRARALTVTDAARPRDFFARTIALFEQSIASDPMFAPAYCGLATTYATRSVQFPLDHPAEELSNMRAAAERAIQLDPLLPDAQAAHGMVLAREGEWAQAERSFRRAIELDPNRAETYVDYVNSLLAVLGRHQDALLQLERAAQADPLSVDIQRTRASVLIQAGRYDEAVAHCRKLPSGVQCLARALSAQGKFAETIELLANHPAVSRNPQTRGFLGYAYARSGRRADAEAMAAASSYANERALIFAGLGDKERTLEALDGMTRLGGQRVGVYLHYPELALLRGDPRLQALRKKVGLPL